jgi:hypothetical protein
MQSNHSTVLATLQRVQRFVDTHADVLGDGISKSGTKAILDESVNALSTHAAQQAGSKRAARATTAKVRVLRAALRNNHLKPIASVAAAQLSQVPEFIAFKMPKGNASPQVLIDAATAMGTAAGKYAQTFVTAGLPADFGASLATAIADYKTALTNKGAAKNKQSGATAGIKAEVQRGQGAVKVLDSIIEVALAANAPLLAEWKSARKFTGKAKPIPSTTVDSGSKGAVGSTTADPVGNTGSSANATSPAPNASAAPPASGTPTTESVQVVSTSTPASATVAASTPPAGASHSA